MTDRNADILYFSWLRSKIGVAREAVALPEGGVTVSALIDILKARSPGHTEAFTDVSVVRAAVNQEHVRLDAPVFPGDEVAFFPPVTGG